MIPSSLGTPRRFDLPGRSVSHTVFFRYHYSFGNFRTFLYVVFSPGAVGFQATFGFVHRIVFALRSGFITRFHHWSWSLAQVTLAFLLKPEGYIRVPSGVDIHTSPASGYCVPASHLFPSISPPQCVSITGSFPHCMLS